MNRIATDGVRGFGYRVRLVALLAALGVLGQARPAPAQGAGPGLTGQRVRITTGQDQKPRTGVLTEVTTEMLAITTGGSAEPIRVRRADVVDLRVSRGMKRHTLQGLLAGAVAWGAVVGVVAAVDTLDESGVGEPLFVGSLLAAGAGIGSLVKREHWERVPESALAVSVAVAAGGYRVRLALRF